MLGVWMVSRMRDNDVSGTIVRVFGEPHRRSPTSLTLRALSEDQQGWTIAVQLRNEPLQCKISGYFFEHALRSFSKALRSCSGSSAVKRVSSASTKSWC